MTVKEMMKLRIATIPRLILTSVLALCTVFMSRALGQGQRGEKEPQRPDVIKVSTALVTVPVVVTDRYGQFVPGLSRNDFTVRENGEVNFLGDFTSDRREIERAIRSVKSSYATSLYDAIHLTITEKLAPIKGRKAIVALTDGVDTWSRQATYESTLELVANAGVSSYAIQYDTRNDGDFRAIAVSVKGGDFSVRARQGYRAPKDEKAEEKDQDKKSGN